MAFFRKDEKQSPREKAQTATMGIIARLGGCGYLIYIMIKLVRSAKAEGSGISPTTTYAIVGVMIAATIAVLAMTVSDLLRGVREHQFDSQRYYDEEFRKQGFTQEEIDEIRARCNETGETMEDVMREISFQALLNEAEAASDEGGTAGPEAEPEKAEPGEIEPDENETDETEQEEEN